jgi:hypothetical protein
MDKSAVIVTVKVAWAKQVKSCKHLNYHVSIFEMKFIHRRAPVSLFQGGQNGEGSRA